MHILLYFGLGAIIGAALGSFSLNMISRLGVFYHTSIWGYKSEVNFIEFLLGIVMLVFALVEFYPRIVIAKIPLSIGGFISGFFGGLSGHQGALRTVFLAHRHLDKKVFIATGVAVSLLVDVTRLSFYQTNLATLKIPYELLIVGVLSALAGSILGKLLLEKTTMKVIQKIVGLALIILGVSILTGLI